MKFKKISVILMAVPIFSLGAVVGANGAEQIQEIKASVNYGMKMLLNGNPYTPVSSDGQTIAPIIYKGSSYLPVRVVGDALGVPINYDSESQTIMIGEFPGRGIELSKYSTKGGDLTYTSAPEQLSIHGEKITDGFYINNIRRNTRATHLFKLPNSFTKLSMRVGTVGEGNVSIAVTDIDTDKEFKKVTISESDGFVELDFEIIGGKNLYIVVRGPSTNPDTSNNKVVITDAYLK